VADAEARVALFESVRAEQADSQISWRKAAAKAAPTVPWPTFVKVKRRYERGVGEPWERMLDMRVPPPQTVREEVRQAARALRKVDPNMREEAARKFLMAQFGDEGDVSDTWLKRIWAEAGLQRPRRGRPAASPVKGVVAEEEQEEVEVFHGGGGLALVAAADAEVGLMQKHAERAQLVGTKRAEEQSGQATVSASDDTAGRDDHGRFTAEYNARYRAAVPAGEADRRWTTDEAKSGLRSLSSLPTLSMNAATLAGKLLAMGVMPMLTERRGFDGLDGPSGGWLGVLGGVAYMPATLDKALAELGLLDVGNELWDVHARTWATVSKPWSDPGPGWLQTAVYIDGTADPYWTRAFAKSGKVSRVGRVMPCLTRIAVHSGAGVPLLVETHVGAVGLRSRLLPLLTRLDEAIGPDADVERLTVVDAEGGTAGTLWALHQQTRVTVITLLKGQVLAGARVHGEGPWQKYRERDQIREVEVDLEGVGVPEGGIRVRGVQMQRTGGRNPHTTLFVTNGGPDALSTEDVPTRYLQRWPLQEQPFRTARNGGGLERSHGYGGEYVVHSALESKVEQAERAKAHAQRKHAAALETRRELADALRQVPGDVRDQALGLADRHVRDAARHLARNEAAQARLQTQPDQIYVRDVGRDSIMTCLRLGTLALVEYVLQEYFGGLQMEWRTFIEQFVALPLTVRTTRRRRLFQLQANPRQPGHMAHLARAVAEINRRQIRRGGQLLVFELAGLPEAGS
jgi:hypothetical protein